MAHNITNIPGAVGFKDIRNNLMKHPSKKYDTRSLSTITHIAVHHSAGPTSQTPYDFAKFHVQSHGWPGIGYHFCIAADGTVEWVNNLETISYHVKNTNTHLVGVEMTGNFEQGGNKPTDAQYKSLYAVLAYLKGVLNVPSANVMGHKEFPGQSTDCPGKNVNMSTIRSNYASGKATGSGGGGGFSRMPTVADYHGPKNGAHGQKNLPSRIKGTDKWNDNLYRIATKEGVNPVFMKTIMTMESAGQASISKSSAGAVGIMQIVPRYHPEFNFSRMRTDPDYAIECGCKVIKGKIKDAKRMGSPVTIKEIAWRYYGKVHNKTAESYGTQAAEIYGGFGLPTSDSPEGTPSGGNFSGGGEAGSGDSGGGPYMGNGSGVYGQGSGVAGSGWKDGGIGGEEIIQMPEYAIAGKATKVADDEYPAHRFAGHPFVLRIGDVQMFIPPDQITIQKTSSIEGKENIRQVTPTMTKAGFSNRELTIPLYFADADQINGYPIKGPNGQTYYMDGLRALLAQFMKNPFLPIRNEWINYTHDIYNVALSSISVETDPNYDNVLKATLRLMECTVEPFIHFPDDMFDTMFMYPVFRWWYQQLLEPDRTKAYSNVFLRPLEDNDMNGKIGIRVLSSEKLNDKIQDVEGQDKGMYKLAKMKWSDIDKEFMMDWEIGEPVIKGIKIDINKTLAPIRMDDREISAFQDMGTMTKTIQLQMSCTREELESLNALSTYMEALSRDFRHKFVSGFGKIGNEILNLCGIYYFMIQEIYSVAATDPSAGELFDVVLVLAAFDPTQKNHERFNGLNSKVSVADDYYKSLMSPIIESKTNRKSEIIYETKMEKALELMEMYPDLELPTYDTINEIIPKINKLREENKYQRLPFDEFKKPPDAVFVDPDFYIAYPSMESVLENFKLDDAGQKYLNLLTSGSYSDIGSQDQDLNFKGLLDQMQGSITENWRDEEKQNIRAITGNKSIDLSKAGYIRYMEVGKPWHFEGNPIPDPIKDAASLAEMAHHDTFRYGKPGRFLKAFPTYLIVLIDEGLWLDGRRLWNNYYTYHALTDINVVRDKNSPLDLAYITLSNTYGAFDQSARLTDPRDIKEPKGIWGRFKSLYNDFDLSWTDKQIRERTQLADEIKLKQGARIHIRLGYGSSAAGLPICFNGHVAEVNEGQDLQLLCQSDGVELINQGLSFDPNATTGSEDIGKESRNVFKTILTRRYSDYWFQVSDKLNFFNNYESRYGIEHFGVVESKAQDGFLNTVGDLFKHFVSGWWNPWGENDDDGLSVNAYDVMKNIYRGNSQASTNEAWLFDGEHNIELTIYNKTAWDIFQAHANFNPEFICATHYHGFRSTVFFGMPHWMVKYGYRFKKDLGLKGGDDETKIDNYVEITKPFQQLHTVTSGVDIIHNDVKASSEQIVHIAVGGYVKGSGHDVATAFAVYADRSIKKSVQKSMLVDTGVSQNYWGPEWLYNTIGFSTIGQLLNVPGDTAQLIGDALIWLDDLPVVPGDYLDGIGKKMNAFADSYQKAVDPERIFNNGAVTARDVSIGALQRKFMEMYQNEIIMLGKPEMKPWDIFYLTDSHNAIAGTVQVGKITHMMNVRQGFVSTVKPDLSVARSDNLERNAWLQLAALTGIAVSQHLLRKLLASNVAKTIGRASTKAAGKGALKLGKGIGRVARPLGIVPRTAGVGWDAIKAGKSAEFLKTGGRSLLKGAKTLIRSNLITTVLLGFLVTQVEQIMKKELMFNNCIYIYPLWKAGKPFVAGIQGGKYIIPNYIDPEYAPDGQQEREYMTVSPYSGGGNSNAKNDGSNANNSGGSNEKNTGKVVHPVPDTRGVSSWYMPPHRPTHYGIDLRSKGSGDTKILCIADGTVLSAAKSTTAGNWVQVRHKIDGQDYVSIYMHMKNGSLKVKAGDKIKAGQQIGIMGTTGHSTGIHLHIEICKGTTRVTRPAPGNHVDPKKFFDQFGIKMKQG